MSEKTYQIFGDNKLNHMKIKMIAQKKKEHKKS